MTILLILQAGRAVVLLSDTAVYNVGGLQDVGLHLLGVAPALPAPRKPASPPAELLAALEGRYRLEGGPNLKLFVRQGTLYVHADGQTEHSLGHDSEGDFYPLDLDARLTPQRTREGMTFVWSQGGGEVTATREPGPDGKKAAGPKTPLPAVISGDYLGEYPLVPGFGLTVSAEQGRLYVRGTGQERIPIEAVARDIFTADSVGAELTFERDDKGRVKAVTLRQAGQRMRGERRAAASAPATR